jgi:hypothetical protein
VRRLRFLGLITLSTGDSDSVQLLLTWREGNSGRHSIGDITSRY